VKYPFAAVVRLILVFVAVLVIERAAPWLADLAGAVETTRLVYEVVEVLRHGWYVGKHRSRT
jgi:hypothetical protein